MFGGISKVLFILSCFQGTKLSIRMSNEIGQRNQGKAARTGNSEGVIFHQDNARPHTFLVTGYKLFIGVRLESDASSTV